MDSMKSKEMVFDFIYYIISTVFIAFVIYWIIYRNGIESAKKIVEIMMIFSVFAIPFLIKLKKNKKIIKRKSKDKSDDINELEIIKYLYLEDKIKDWVAIIFISMIILCLPLFFGEIAKDDIVQAFFVFYLIVVLHKYFFRKKDYNGLDFLTHKDKAWDDNLLYFFPLFIFSISILIGNVNKIDVIQSITIFVLFGIWHYYFFKETIKI